MTRCHEPFNLPVFSDSDTFTNDLLKYFDATSPIHVFTDKQDDIISVESDCSSLITNRQLDEMCSNISTLETSATITTDDKRFYIKEHESPSTSAAAIAAAEAVTSNHKNTYPPSLLQKKSMFRKSSAFFNEKLLGKKSSALTMEEYKKIQIKASKRSSGFTIKQQKPKPKWWKSFKFT